MTETLDLFRAIVNTQVRVDLSGSRRKLRTYKGSPLNAKDLCNPDLAPAWETAAPDTGAVAIVTLARPLVSRTMNCSASIVRGFVLTAAIDPSAASRISATTPRRK
jgi:hypothetical protein